MFRLNQRVVWEDKCLCLDQTSVWYGRINVYVWVRLAWGIGEYMSMFRLDQRVVWEDVTLYLIAEEHSENTGNLLHYQEMDVKFVPKTKSLV